MHDGHRRGQPDPRASSAARRALFRGSIRPVSEIFDVSVREPATTTVYGQTTRSLLRNYELVRRFGLSRTLVAAFSYGDRYTVQDQLVEELRRAGDDLAGCYASFTIGDHRAALAKIERHAVPNVFVDFFVGDEDGAVDGARARRLAGDLLATLGDLRSMLPAASVGANGRPVGEIFVNFGDYFEQRDRQAAFFDALFEEVRRRPVDAICFEEYRGAGLPEDVLEAAARLRERFPFGEHKLLAHVHGGNGLDDACNLAAVAGGADGVWAGLAPTAALAGHGSSLVFLTNLFRYGNVDCLRPYDMRLAHEIVRELHRSDFAGREAMPLEMPLFGRNAYSVNLASFSQDAPLPGLVPGAMIGAPASSRFVPLKSDRRSIEARLAELGVDGAADGLVEALLDAVHQHLLDDLHSPTETRVDFNSAEYLTDFVARRAGRR